MVVINRNKQRLSADKMAKSLSQSGVSNLKDQQDVPESGLNSAKSQSDGQIKMMNEIKEQKPLNPGRKVS